MDIKDFEEHLEYCYNKLDNISDRLTEVHSNNMKKLQQSYMKSIEKLHIYKYTITEIIMSIKSPSQKIFPKIIDMQNSGKNLLDYEKKLFEFKELEFTEIEENLYEFADFKVFDTWKPVDVESCDHQERRIIVTNCRKGHCVNCIEDLIFHNTFECPCRRKLSPKDVYQIQGNEINFKELLKKLVD